METVVNIPDNALGQMVYVLVVYTCEKKGL